MIKILHLSLIFCSLSGFGYRVYLLNFRPEALKKRWLKIAPHIIDTLVLISGATLVMQGNWLTAGHDWLAAKLLGLLGYIGFGIAAMRCRTPLRHYALAATLSCFLYIIGVAISKNPLPI